MAAIINSRSRTHPPDSVKPGICRVILLLAVHTQHFNSDHLSSYSRADSKNRRTGCSCHCYSNSHQGGGVLDDKRGQVVARHFEAWHRPVLAQCNRVSSNGSLQFVFPWGVSDVRNLLDVYVFYSGYSLVLSAVLFFNIQLPMTWIGWKWPGAIKPILTQSAESSSRRRIKFCSVAVVTSRSFGTQRIQVSS